MEGFGWGALSEGRLGSVTPSAAEQKPREAEVSTWKRV